MFSWWTSILLIYTFPLVWPLTGHMHAHKPGTKRLSNNVYWTTFIQACNGSTVLQVDLTTVLPPAEYKIMNFGYRYFNSWHGAKTGVDWPETSCAVRNDDGRVAMEVITCMMQVLVPLEDHKHFQIHQLAPEQGVVKQAGLEYCLAITVLWITAICAGSVLETSDLFQCTSTFYRLLMETHRKHQAVDL